MSILIITGGFTNNLELLGDRLRAAGVSVRTAYRTYYVEEWASDPLTTIIVGDGTCKMRDEGGVAAPVSFSATELAAQYDKQCFDTRETPLEEIFAACIA